MAHRDPGGDSLRDPNLIPLVLSAMPTDSCLHRKKRNPAMVPGIGEISGILQRSRACRVCQHDQLGQLYRNY